MYDFTKAVRDKKYTLKSLGKRWNLGERMMEYIARDPKQIHWDALKGVPKCTKN